MEPQVGTKDPRHWEGCWSEHHACAVYAVRQLQKRALEWIEARGDLSSRLRVARTEIARLQGIVDKLPKTADGVPMVLGETYYVSPGGWAITIAVLEDKWVKPRERIDRCLWWTPQDCYSTREAAEAAKGEG